MAACKRQSSSRGETCETSGAGEKRKKIGPGSGGDEGIGSECGSSGRECGDRVRCGLEFFDQPCVDLARALLGCVLVCCEGGEECRGEVVEVEAYLGGKDKAAHSYNGRRSRANEAMYMAPGTAYVYCIYGMHCCFNVSSRGEGAAVLVRALRPMAGLGAMRRRRERRGRGEAREMRDIDLCSGPGKLCQAMGITKQHNQMDMVTSSSLWLEMGKPLSPELIKVSPRVGIDSAGMEWASALLRFYQDNCHYVSRTHSKRT